MKSLVHVMSIEDAVSSAQPRDTIELGVGHNWVKDLTINFPLCFVGDENDPSHVAIELSGSICWTGSGGWIEGVTIRRPRLSNDFNNNKLMDYFKCAERFNVAFRAGL
jgi:hypothetical protein